MNVDGTATPEGQQPGGAVSTLDNNEGGLNWDQFDRNHPQEPVGGQGVDTQPSPGPDYVQAKEESGRLSTSAPARTPEVAPLSATATQEPAGQASVERPTSETVPVGRQEIGKVEGVSITDPNTLPVSGGQTGGVTPEASGQAGAAGGETTGVVSEVPVQAGASPAPEKKRSMFDRIFRRNS